MPTKNLYSIEDTFMHYVNNTTNYGTNNYIQTYNYVLGDERMTRGLVKFDMGALPSSAMVSSATMYLYNTWGTGTGRVNVFRVIASWVETEATWIRRITGTSWATAGCDNTTSDRSSTLSGYNANIGAVGWYSVSLNLTEFDLMRTNNYGYILINGANYEKHYYSRHYSSGAYSPYITVEYTLPPSVSVSYLSDYGII